MSLHWLLFAVGWGLLLGVSGSLSMLGKSIQALTDAL
jgi:hypothetical protein